MRCVGVYRQAMDHVSASAYISRLPSTCNSACIPSAMLARLMRSHFTSPAWHTTYQPVAEAWPALSSARMHVAFSWLVGSAARCAPAAELHHTLSRGQPACVMMAIGHVILRNTQHAIRVAQLLMLAHEPIIPNESQPQCTPCTSCQTASAGLSSTIARPSCICPALCVILSLLFPFSSQVHEAAS